MILLIFFDQSRLGGPNNKNLFPGAAGGVLPNNRSYRGRGHSDFPPFFPPEPGKSQPSGRYLSNVSSGLSPPSPPPPRSSSNTAPAFTLSMRSFASSNMSSGTIIVFAFNELMYAPTYMGAKCSFWT